MTARVKVRPKAQLTLPEEIRRALHIGEGDEVGLEEPHPAAAGYLPHLPEPHRVVRDFQRRILQFPQPLQPGNVKYPAWSALGHAIDYRLRLCLGWPVAPSSALPGPGTGRGP
jgi:AbrB family looped-hinge helix DNA binding protein